MKTIKYKIKGLSCIACKKLSEKRISKIVGVKSVDVDIKSGIALISSEKEVSLDDVRVALHDTPYEAQYE